MPHFFYRLFAVLMAVIIPTTAFAAVDSGDTAWILTATALVLFMTLPGLALFYAGLVQSKNVVSVLMHHFAVACLMSVLWVVAGYSLAFSGDGAWMIKIEINEASDIENLLTAEAYSNLI